MPVRSFERISAKTDVVTTRTFLHEVIPVSGSIVSGTYTDGDTETNIKNFTHGMFQAVYDYPYLSSSANHIFDLTAGYSAKSSLSSSSNIQNAKKINMYNQFAQVLLGYTGSKNDVRLFESDLVLDQVNQMKDVFIISLSRLLTKDEIKKGSFSLSLGRGAYGNPFNTAKATATITTTGAPGDGETFTLTDAAGLAVGFIFKTGVTTVDGTKDGDNVIIGVSGAIGSAAAVGDRIRAAIAASDAAMTVAETGAGAMTLTQDAAGPSGNTTIDMSGVTTTTATSFTGGADQLTLGDYIANPDGTGVLNCDGGDMSILFTGSDASIGDIGYGAIFYQAGVVVLTSSVFADVADFGSAHLNTAADLDAEQTLIQSSISGTCNALRHRIRNIQFNNTTELNSSIYFCRAPANKFNYSSNPTYLSASQLRVKSTADDEPVSYITTVGLYGANNELLAVAKLSEPIKKTPANELTVRVRLDY